MQPLQGFTELEAEAELFKKRLEYLEGGLADLRDELDRRNEETRSQIDRQRDIVSEKITNMQNAVKELQLMIYGEPKYRLSGLSAQIDGMNTSLVAMQAERQSLRDQIKGMRTILIVMSALGPLLGPVVVKFLGELLG
jgi:chromosome segregation ATPase